MQKTNIIKKELRKRKELEKKPSEKNKIVKLREKRKKSNAFEFFHSLGFVKTEQEKKE